MLFSRIFRRNYAKKFDVAVIGGGPGGYVAAIKSAQLGLKAACIESRGSLGGTCLNVGCIPSKALLNSSYLHSFIRDKGGLYGSKINGLELDLPAMLKQKDDSVSSLVKGIEGLFKKNGVDYLKGHGSFVSDGKIKIVSSEGSEEIEASKIIVATGSAPIQFPDVPFDEKQIISSTGALSLDRVPDHLVVVGGGIIGLELGSVWRRLGAKVTVIEYMDSIGAGMDRSVSTAFQKILQKQGIQFILNTKVDSIKKGTPSIAISTSGVKSNEKQTLDADVVLVSIGRKPHTEKLGLENVTVEVDKKGRIITDTKFQTTNKNIFAIGDVINGPMLAHKAEEEGIAVAEYLAGGHGHVNYNSIPSVVYTHPEVAWVGKTEEQLKSENSRYVSGSFPFLANSRAKTNNDTEGFVKILAEENGGKILGAHIIGPNAGEMISEAVLAIEYGASAEDIARTCHAHPTLSEAFKEACMTVYGLKKPIHM